MCARVCEEGGVCVCVCVRACVRVCPCMRSYAISLSASVKRHWLLQS